MPNVNGKKFPYTEKGKAEAAAAMADNPKFLKPGTGKPGSIKPPTPRPVGSSGATTKPAVKPQIAAIAAMRKKQASR